MRAQNADRLVDVIKYQLNQRLVLLQKLISSENKKYIYGAGMCAQNTCALLREYTIEAEGFCVDREYYKENTHIMDRGVYCISDIENDTDDIDLIIGFENRARAMEVIKRYSGTKVKVYFFEDLFCFRSMDYKFFIENIASFQKAYELLEDELSREIFVAHINSRISNDYTEISRYDSKLDYGYDFSLLKIGEQEVFVDCGAFDGDTIEELLRYTNGKYKKIIAFEPDEKNYDILKNKIADHENISVIKSGVSDIDDVKKFYNDGSLYSNFVDTGLWGEKTRRDVYNDVDDYISVPVCKMDDRIKGEGVTVIKMDIEGSELSALRGAEKIITEYHPKLAICIYHKGEDLFSCINYIDSIVGDGVYRYYVRHHSDNITETVLYAVPIN